MGSINWDALPLGDLPDAEIAEMVATKTWNVTRARRRRNIPERWLKKWDTIPSPASTFPPPSPAVGRQTRDILASSSESAGRFSLDAMAKFLRRPRSLEELCDHLDCSPAKAKKQIEDAKKAGMPVALQGDRLTWHLAEESAGATAKAKVAAINGDFQFAVVGDIHFGSKYCREDYLKDFCTIAYNRGIRTFLQVGDVLDGEYRHGVRELRAHGFDEQADECIERLPQMPGAQWYFIDGNHDETFTHSAGIVAGQALVDRALRMGRTDLTYLGQRRGTMRLDCGHPYSPLVELWHPRKHGAYALSYNLQKRCEAYMPGHKPDFLLAGHWHQFCYLTERGIHAMSCGTFQGGGSAFSNSLGSGQAIGATIVNFSLTEHGTLRGVGLERINYFEREEHRMVQVA